MLLNCNTIYVDEKIRIVRMEDWFGFGAYLPEIESLIKNYKKVLMKKTYLFYQFNQCVNENNRIYNRKLYYKTFNFM